MSFFSTSECQWPAVTWSIWCQHMPIMVKGGVSQDYWTDKCVSSRGRMTEKVAFFNWLLSCNNSANELFHGKKANVIVRSTPSKSSRVIMQNQPRLTKHCQGRTNLRVTQVHVLLRRVYSCSCECEWYVGEKHKGKWWRKKNLRELDFRDLSYSAEERAKKG